ncbi:MAG TPA: thiamine phosphate synthase [Vicinamibacterales bacterium]|nr:thiamine phosphate synthase [Vicinamibacterales bacterium]
MTDRRRVARDVRTDQAALFAFERWLDDVVLAGPDVIQIRERDLDAGTLVRLVAGLVERTAGTAVAVVVNDRADVACAARAAGVHLRADGPPAARVRALGPATWRIGRSAHSVAEVRDAGDVDYVFVGPIHPSASKPGIAPAGLELVTAAARATSVPVIAIGGLDVDRLPALLSAGAFGVAGIGVFLPPGCGQGAIGPARAVAGLRARMLE